jgi:hypothetical protein
MTSRGREVHDLSRDRGSLSRDRGSLSRDRGALSKEVSMPTESREVQNGAPAAQPSRMRGTARALRVLRYARRGRLRHVRELTASGTSRGAP